jgi:hypothetical protein
VDDFGAADPIDLNVDVAVIADAQSRLGSVAWLGGQNPSLLADESGVYWYDVNGSVFAWPRGESEVIELLAGVESVYDSVAAEGPTPVVMSLVAGADHLYAGEADAVDTVDRLGGAPPSRLLSIPKRGGPATVLVESERELLVPLAVDAERLLVVGHGPDATQLYHQVSLANPELLPFPPELVREASGSSGGAADDVFRDWQARRREQYDFSVCPGYFLARHAGDSIHSLFMLDAASGNERTFSRIGARIGTPVCDERHVYFYSTGGFQGIVEQPQIVRVDVESGQLTRLVSPDLILQNNFSILGQDAENVYANNGDTVLAIRKP